MDEEIALGSLIALVLIGLGSLVLIALLPSWFVIQGNWEAYRFWFNIGVSISRVLYIIQIPLYLFFAIIYVKVGYGIGAIQSALLGIWGMPVYKKAVLSLAFTPLSGIELQRTIIIIIVVYGLSIWQSLITKADDKREDHN